ncbi:LCP family protein [Nocardioides sp. URHA0020]|uniref:LCP family protein n=1 Tax=Nocardioides sp. URHA0020 TaxID=1380392 RepID=UPI00068751C0|nr:LCP family protein [Nocardioides sp. URHA0020]
MSSTTKALLGLFCCLTVLAVGAAGTLLVVQHRLDSQVTRMDGVFDGLDDRPARVAEGPAADALNILLIGTDARTDQATTGSAATAGWTPGAQRSDTLMLLHLSADRKTAAIVSFPRDSWVDVPGHGRAKINAAFSWGGPSLAVATVEQLTSIHIDHLAWIDWSGFEALTDVLGGVRVWVPRTVYDSARDVTWDRGMHTLDGKDALLYVRQRHGLPGGDFDRIQRQQYFLRAMMDSVRHEFSLANPRSSYHLIDAATRHLTVDEGFSTRELRDLMNTMTGMRSDKVEFLTTPIAGLGYEGQQSVVYLDLKRAQGLWKAVRSDRTTRWANLNPITRTPQQVR